VRLVEKVWCQWSVEGVHSICLWVLPGSDLAHPGKERKKWKERAMNSDSLAVNGLCSFTVFCKSAVNVVSLRCLVLYMQVNCKCYCYCRSPRQAPAQHQRIWRFLQLACGK
jgi:hypothetical protein